MATWYICGGSIFWARRSKTTESPPSGVRGVSVGSVGIVGFFVAMNSFYRGFHALWAPGLKSLEVNGPKNPLSAGKPHIDKIDNRHSN
jgi:hypothetical protein